VVPQGAIQLMKVQIMKTKSIYENSHAAASMLAAMANPKRLLILCTLVEGEIAVGPLATKIGLSQSALSQHLSKLRALNLVQTRRDAQTIYYSCNSSSVASILESLEGIYSADKRQRSAA